MSHVYTGGRCSVSATPQLMSCTEVLQALIIDRGGGLDDYQRQAHDHHFTVTAARKRRERRDATKAVSTELAVGQALPAPMRRALARARTHQETGTIYSMVPSELLGTTLDATVFYDSTAVRFNYPNNPTRNVQRMRNAVRTDATRRLRLITHAFASKEVTWFNATTKCYEPSSR
jgi:hypothetical protein